ncbi:MAG: Gfo/Idh/MocA family oxidoreductase [Verrucomicrobiales bacterium]|nr:Gfo/Idh/MocA family oxidoreductase [Verrucomicrobiales bacterium]
MKLTTRRKFLAHSAIALPAILPALNGRAAPGERITMAFVGMGNRGIGVMEAFLNHADVQGVAICDVHDLHYRDREWGKGRALGRKPGKALVDNVNGNSDCVAYSDYRELLERDDLDAIMVASPDHWHYNITMAALKKGLDVYCEKPVTHLFAEGQDVYREVAKREAIFQVGSQQRSDPLFRKAVEIVRNGHLGKLSGFEVGLPAGYPEPMGDTKIAPIPEGLDYDMWCGPGEKLPYMRARHHRWWRGHTEYGGGNLMDFIGHHNDIAHWGMGYENSGPVKVETRKWNLPETDIYNTPVDYEIRCTYPDGKIGIISSQYTGGAKWIGAHGWVRVNRGKLEASNPEWLEDSFDPGPWKAYRSPGHQRNFIDSVKSRKETVAPAENGHRSITPGHLAMVAAKTGRAIQWDPEQEVIIDDDAAQAELVKREYREWSA